ncbi:MAG: DNA polymerase III subunit delta [Actinobacteria bacterium]|uniref:DNA-directed DNA polymerase n=1 Tax=freshwater metagenome TaxID=449393 RepID=A0A6J5Z6K3_9ZZZZ|nr:DNA polymerase III subunit delta [Actinomycetota bacterium]
MAKTTAASDAHVVLAVGKEAVLANRVIELVMKSARAADPATVRVDIVASNEDAAGDLANVLSPSLFGETTVVVITNIHEVKDEVSTVVLNSLSDLADHVRMVLVHPGVAKGKKFLDAVRKFDVREASCDELKGKALEEAVAAEFKVHKRKVTAAAISKLVESVGSNLGELFAAVSQLSADVEGDLIEDKDVQEFYAGVADVKGWDLSDAMWNAKPLEVLEQFRWALANDSGASPTMIWAIASGLRTLLKYASAPAGMSEVQLASHLGVPPWRIKYLKTQKNKWHPDQLALATRLLVLADRASKGTVYDSAIPGGRSLDESQAQYEIEKNLLAIRPPR